MSIMTGQADISAFDTYVQNWKAQGGDTILAAVEEGYEAVGIEVTDTYYTLGTERVRYGLEMGSQKEGEADKNGK